ncbi:MAG: SMC-Scp complex subunit ScpB [bacterium]|nr:SMC-Scp complex subunit ScpB [bacterium]
MTTDQAIEAILFFKAEPVRLDDLRKILGTDLPSVKQALESLEKSLASRGIRLMSNGEEVTLVTAPEVSELIEKLSKEELSRELSRAALETLSIILYKNPIARKEIDFIRGVNSHFILRSLLIKGLVEKTADEKDQRVTLYKPTLDLFAHLGITRAEDLPLYGRIQSELVAFENQSARDNSENNGSAE